MPFKSLILLILILGIIPASSLANDRFISVCQKDMDYWQHAWLDKLFGSWNCKELDKKISRVRSFEEILPDVAKVNVINNWLGFTLPAIQFGVEGPSNYGYLKHLFGDVDDFIGFENLKHISLVDRDYNNACDIVSKFPHLKTMTILRNDFLKEGVDDCLSAAGIEGVYVVDEKIYNNEERVVLPFVKTKTKVLGIERWLGSFEELSKLKFLKYLDYDTIRTTKGLEVLNTNYHLTHLSMGTASFEGFSNVRFLRELRHLIMKSYDNSPEKTPEDINFLSELPWLKTLILPDNRIKDISVLNQLKYLEYVNLEGNKIESIPDLSQLKNLRYLDLNTNRITTMKDFSASEALIYLNLAQNRLTDFSQLKYAGNLRALNLSGNTLVDTLNLPPLPKLKVLSLDGGDGIERGKTSYATRESLKKNLSSDAYDLIEVLDVDIFNEEESCKTRKTFVELGTLPEMPELEVLTLRNQNLTEIPDLSMLPKLKYLNLSRNGFPEETEVNIPSLKMLNIANRTNSNQNPWVTNRDSLEVIRYESLQDSFRCFWGPR